MIVNSAAEAISEIHDGSSVMIGGFGEAGSQIETIYALIDHGAKNHTVASNNAGSGHVVIAAPIENKQVKKMICSFPLTGKEVVERINTILSIIDVKKEGLFVKELAPNGSFEDLQQKTESKLNQYAEMKD
jgi:acyl CoA:acetate/3-ketoacid CoA transferase alpha subunit